MSTIAVFNLCLLLALPHAFVGTWAAVHGLCSFKLFWIVIVFNINNSLISALVVRLLSRIVVCNSCNIIRRTPIWFCNFNCKYVPHFGLWRRHGYCNFVISERIAFWSPLNGHNIWISWDSTRKKYGYEVVTSSWRFRFGS